MAAVDDLIDGLKADVARAQRSGVAPDVLERALRLSRQALNDYAELFSPDAAPAPESALEAMVLGGPGRAYDLASAELGPLAAPGERPARLRATLEAWLDCGESRARAADALGIAPRTVGYRLSRVEVLLGHPIADRRAELQLALRLRRRFGAS